MARQRGPSLRSALKKGNLPRQKPIESLMVGEWRVEFVREVHPRNFMKTPLVILGGVLPHFESFREEALAVSKSRPVYIVDLPGLGNNSQIAKDLDYKDLADILKNFLDQLGLESVIPVGHLASSPIVYYFSTMYPDSVEKAILNGASDKLRSSVKLLIKDILHSLENEGPDEFATRMVMGFMNYSMRDKVLQSSEMSEELHKHYLELAGDDSQVQRQKVNLERLLHQEELGSGPRCPTMVVVGEYDNFTTAYDGYRVVSDCLRGVLAVVKSGDHLVTQGKVSQVLKAIEQFMDNGELDEVRGVNVWKKNDFPVNKRRLQPRFQLEQKVQIQTMDGKTFESTLSEISRQGCHVLMPEKWSELAEEQILKLEIPHLDFEVELLVFDMDQKSSTSGMSLRGLFKANSFDKARQTEKVIQQLVDEDSAKEPKKQSVSA